MEKEQRHRKHKLKSANPHNCQGEVIVFTVEVQQGSDISTVEHKDDHKSQKCFIIDISNATVKVAAVMVDPINTTCTAPAMVALLKNQMITTRAEYNLIGREIILRCTT